MCALLLLVIDVAAAVAVDAAPVALLLGLLCGVWAKLAFKSLLFALTWLPVVVTPSVVPLGGAERA